MPDDTRLIEPTLPAEARGPAPAATETPPAPQPTPPQPSPKPWNQRRRRRWLRWGLFLLLPIALIVGAYLYFQGGGTVTTDDAYIEADTVGLSTDVSGMVKSVEVTDNQHVRAGQVLFRLDPQPFQFKLDQANTQLGIVRENLTALKANYRNIEAQIRQAQDQLAYNQRQYQRAEILARQGVAAQTTLEQTQVAARNSADQIKALQAQLASVAANLNGNPDAPVEQSPQYKQALAQRDEAARELHDTVVAAPFEGIVTNVPSLRPGMYLPASTTAFYLVNTDRLWVEAQPKETQLTYVRPGQPVTITVDAYPGRTWHGTVASRGPAAQSQFSLLPAQNTSGNWVKVVQRIPLRIDIDTSDKSMPPLSAGMSVEVSIDTGHKRGWPHFLTALFGGG
ncbi:MAG TPA: HlyD family secretion protein [Stellaceae bacterium]|nr:HlyD family secretion protein [Stellaceae bacterium]